MTIIQKLRAALVIRQVAKQQGISTARCRAEIQEAIDAAWATSDPEVKLTQIQLVGDSHVPSPEEFMLLVADQI